MNTLFSQIRYLKERTKPLPDPLKNLTEIAISQSTEKVKILFRQREGSSWKYCIAPIIFNSVLYTFLKIRSIQQNISALSNNFFFQVQIHLETLKQPQKSLFTESTDQQLNNVLKSISSFSAQTFSCQLKSSQQKQRKIAYKFITKKQCKYIAQKAVKTSFFAFFIIIDRLKSYKKVNKQKALQLSSEMCELRYSLTSSLKSKKQDNKKTPKQVYDQYKSQQNQINKHCSVISLSNKSLFEGKNTISLAFAQNAQKKNKLQKMYLKSQEKRKNQIQKEKIYSNIQIQKEQLFKGFCIQTKFSIITQCSLVFKILQTHMNRKYDFDKSTQNLQYFNYLVNITKTQSKICVRKKPLQPSIEQITKKDQTKQRKVNENQLKQKTKRILKTQKNCLDIMKDSWVANICPYYVHKKEEDTLYSKLYRMSLDEWKQSDLPCKGDILIDIFLQILNGLHEMGLHNIIHRDLKPDNILVDQSDPLKPVVKLIDFGSTIYIHSDQQTYQQNVQQNFDSKLRTTKPYNMDLNQFRKICCTFSPHNLYKYTQSSYNRHAKFDLHSVGKIMEEFKEKFTNQEVSNNINFLIRLCTCPDPEFRLNLEQTALFLTTIKNFYFPL